MAHNDHDDERLQLIAVNLRALRKRHGLTLREVAQVCGLSIPHLANVERGSRSISGEHLRLILQVYGYSLSVFLSLIESYLASPNSDDTAPARQYSPIMLVGRDRHDSQLLLLRPTYSREQPAPLLLVLPPGAELWHAFLTLPEPCGIICGQGVLLVETQHREYTLKEGQYLELAAHIAHRFRNHTPTETRAYIWTATACV